VIGLGPNLFYGTGIPAAILILRAKGSKPAERRGKVLFINADRDYGEGRAQNHLRPQDEEKITATYRNFADVDGFARVVTLDELADNDFNCNIRRYADNAPPPEPHDVRAHLHGGVPMTEIDDAKDLLERAGLDPDTLFADRGDGYADWRHTATSTDGRDAAHRIINQAVAQRAANSPWPQWWAEIVEPLLRQLPDDGLRVGQRRQLVKDFRDHMVAAGVDRFAGAGMAATWWEESFHELQTAASRGWKAVIDAWLTTTEASQDDKNAPHLADQTVIKLLAGPQLAERTHLADEHVRLDAKIKTVSDHSLTLAKIKALKSARARAKKKLKAIDASLLATARQTLNAMPPADAPTQAIGVLRSRIEKLVTDHTATIERSILAWYDNLTNKYGTTLRHLETQRDTATARLNQHLKDLGYG
ncbi:MAG: N-6 DNA methylase, partial [bacterium]|nr:N-6 DNA methylase [bacterium]